MLTGCCRYSGGALYCEQVPLEAIAREAGTPCYVYSAGWVRQAFEEYQSALGELPHLICYAVKANSNLALLRRLAEMGAGFDIVSAGELFRVLEAGGDAARVVFSGTGKTAGEMQYALEHGVLAFNCESQGELELLDATARRLRTRARFAIRINPDVNASTHPYISTGLTEHKFGVTIDDAVALYRWAAGREHLTAEGLSCHIGSQILDPSPMVEAAERALDCAESLRGEGIHLRHLDLGGGLGIAYRSEERAPSAQELLNGLQVRLRESGLRVLLEPGRSLAGQAGVLLTQVLYRKRNGSKEFVIVDAGMTDLIRPALYQAHHEIVPVRESHDPVVADIVGPVCESGDFLARHRRVTGAEPGAYLAVLSAGAYGFTQSSNYNSRPRAPEVLVDGDQWRIVRRRETFEDLIRGEQF